MCICICICMCICICIYLYLFICLFIYNNYLIQNAYNYHSIVGSLDVFFVLQAQLGRCSDSILNDTLPAESRDVESKLPVKSELVDSSTQTNDIDFEKIKVSYFVFCAIRVIPPT